MIRNPFKGAFYYEESDREQFFGRESDGAQLFRRLLADREVILYSPSGSGKSSLLRADLMVRLKHRGFLMPESPLRPSTLLQKSKGSEDHLPADIAFGNYLLEAFEISSDASLNPVSSVDKCLARVRASFGPQREAAPIAIVVDQTEEIFTHPDSSITWRQTFLECLGQVARVERVWLVMAVREDFLARLLGYHELFVTELRSRYSLPLIDAHTAREIVDKTLGCVGVKLDVKTLDEVTQCVFESCLPSSERSEAKSKWSQRIIEPLFLQIFGSSWWERAGGDPEKLKLGPFTPNELKSVLAMYIDHCLAQAAESIAKHSETKTDLIEAESRLRDWLGHELIRYEMRSPQLVTDDLSVGADQLEKSYLIHRSQLGERMAELAHDQLVAAIQWSNTRWYAQTPSGQAWKAYQAWCRAGKKRDELLELPRTLEALMRHRKQPPVMKNYLRKSLLNALKWWVFSTGIAMCIIVISVFYTDKAKKAVIAKDEAVIAKDEAVKAKEEAEGKALNAEERAKDAERMTEAYLSAMRSQDRLADAWQYVSKDSAKAVRFGLAAHWEAKDAGDRRISLMSRAEAVLGRALAAPVAVQYLKGKIGEGACAIKNDNGESESAVECMRVPSKASHTVHVQVERDRRHLDSPRRSWHNYSFASVRDMTKPSAVPRRMWLSFGDQALIQEKAVMVGFPSEDNDPAIAAGGAWWEGGDLRGFSLSPGGRLYVWSAPAVDIDACLKKKVFDEKMPTQNDACRILRLEGNVQLFNEPVVAISPVTYSNGSIYASQFEVESRGGLLARVSRLRGHSSGASWPGVDLRTSKLTDAATSFFVYSDKDNKDHVWLVTNGPVVSLAPGAKEAAGKDFKFGRAVWCSQAMCADGVANWFGRDGARATFSLRDKKLLSNPAKSKVANLCAPFLGQAVVLDDGALVLAAGVVPPKRHEDCVVKNPGPVLAIVSNDSSTSSSSDAENFKLLALSEVLPAAMRDDEVDGLAVDGDLLGLVSTAGRAAVCKLASRKPVKLEACTQLKASIVARGIAILGGLSDDVSEVIAVNDRHGQVDFFTRDGHTIPTIASEERAVTTSKSKAPLIHDESNSVLEPVTGTYSPSSNDPKESKDAIGTHLPLLLLKEDNGDVRAIITADDHKVRMRLYEVAKSGARAGVPVVIAEMDSKVRALYVHGDAVYAGSASSTVKRLVTSAAAVRGMACREIQIVDESADGNPGQGKVFRNDLCRTPVAAGQ